MHATININTSICTIVWTTIHRVVQYPWRWPARALQSSWTQLVVTSLGLVQVECKSVSFFRYMKTSIVFNNGIPNVKVNSHFSHCPDLDDRHFDLSASGPVFQCV
ncbi:hypothetical protein J6590_039067 [Homalodisca vitripennis]|nr:hypothetical protein J6590_039067 [Homalodisca vitripennis]